jgi:hypothetical protein
MEWNGTGPVGKGSRNRISEPGNARYQNQN